MGIEPWAQSDLIRDTQRAERARFRRLIDRHLKEERPSGATRIALEIVRAQITPKKPKSKAVPDAGISEGHYYAGGRPV